MLYTGKDRSRRLGLKLFHFQERNLPKGIFFFLLGWLATTILYEIGRQMETSTTIPTLLFFRSVFGVILFLPWVVKEWPKSLVIQKKSALIVSALAALSGLLFIFLAVHQMSLVNATLLNNTAPFFVPIILWLWLKQPIEHKMWGAICLGFVGIFFILQPDREIFNWAALYGLLAGISTATFIITMRISSKAESMFIFLFYFCLVGLIATAPFSILDWKIESLSTLLGLCVAGLLAALSQACFFYGLKFAKAHELAPFSYASVLFAGLIDWWVWGTTPSMLVYVGMACIVGAGIWIGLLGKLPKKVD